MSSHKFTVLTVLVVLALGFAGMADAALIQNSGMTVGGTGNAVTSVDFGDVRGAIPIANLVPTHAVPTTAGGPGIVPEITTFNNRRIWGPNGATQAMALNITGDADLGTVYQVGQNGKSSYTLDLYFATPITTGAYADVWIGQIGAYWGKNLFDATISGRDMAGNLVDSVSVAGVNGQNNNLVANVGSHYIPLDVDGNPQAYNAQGGSDATFSYGINFDAGQTLQGIRIAWTSNDSLLIVSEVRGVNTVPEPASLTLLAAALLGLLAYAWRKRK